MNATPNQPRPLQPARPHRRINYPHENHLDRELRNLRGLSTEVGAACSAWLTNRGVITRSWNQSNRHGVAVKPAALDFSLPNDL